MISTALDATLAERPGVRLTTRGGMRLRLHPAEPADGVAVGDLLSALSAEELRFRFLVTRKAPDAAQLAELTGVDHRRTEHVLAIDEASGRPVASLMIAADAAMENAEVAVAVAHEARGKGIGWALLRHAADLARERGIRTLRSVESRANRDAIELEEALGFHCRMVEDEPGLVSLEAELG